MLPDIAKLVPNSSRMEPNIVKHIHAFPNVVKRIRALSHISKCCQTLPNISKRSQTARAELSKRRFEKNGFTVSRVG